MPSIRIATIGPMTNEMEVAELREALEARGLDSSGLKPALVARLLPRVVMKSQRRLQRT